MNLGQFGFGGLLLAGEDLGIMGSTICGWAWTCTLVQSCTMIKVPGADGDGVGPRNQLDTDNWIWWVSCILADSS